MKLAIACENYQLETHDRDRVVHEYIPFLLAGGPMVTSPHGRHWCCIPIMYLTQYTQVSPGSVPSVQVEARRFVCLPYTISVYLP